MICAIQTFLAYVAILVKEWKRSNRKKVMVPGRCQEPSPRQGSVKKVAPPKVQKFPAAKQRRLDKLLDKNSEGTIFAREKAPWSNFSPSRIIDDCQCATQRAV